MVVGMLLWGGCRKQPPVPAHGAHYGPLPTASASGNAPHDAPHDGHDAARDAPHDGGTLRLHMEAEPPTLNSLVEHDTWTRWITLDAISEPLLRQTAPGSFSPALATAWTAPDPRTLRFTLRPGVTFHDGSALTPEDVIATLDRARGPSAAPDVRADFDALRSVEKTSDREVVLHFDKPQPLALQALSQLAILPAHAFGEGDLRSQPASRAPIGTGPFRLVEWTTGQRIVLARSASYWGQRPHLDRIELLIVRDREAAFELFRRGALDVLWQLTPSQVDRALAEPDFAAARIVPWQLPRYAFIVWNVKSPGLGDRRVRRALTLLTDRTRYLQVAYRGRALPVTGPYPLGSPSYDPSITPWPFDPARARALLDEAGVRDQDGDGMREVDGQPFRVTFLLSAGSPTLEPLVTLMQEDLQRAGIVLQAAPSDWAAMLSRLRRHDFDASSLLWVMQPVQDNWKEFHSSQVDRGQNYGSFKSPEVDRLLSALREAPIGPERWQLDRALHRAIHEEQPYTFLGNPEIDSLVGAGVRGYAPGAGGLGFSSLWIAGVGGSAAAAGGSGSGSKN